MDTPTDILQRVLPLSRALTRLLDADPSLASELEQHIGEALTPATLYGFLPDDLDEMSLKPALRRLKRRALARIAARDLAGQANLAEVTESMTLIAEIAVETARTILTETLSARYGVPRNASGTAQQMLVIGMGKLGGRELNVSSDIDLIFVYPEDGETDGVGRDGNVSSISNFDFFTRLGRNLINAIAEITGDGQVFRVDMRLRPNGDSGPLVCCFEMLENYFLMQGREWERYAWIKARLLPGNIAEKCRDEWLAELEAIRQPFVFRKYLDFGCINAMRELHRQIRREVARKDMAANIKLGPGGIREIEFIAQVFQLIRGGRDAQLQIRPTLQVLTLLVERRQLTNEAAHELGAAYNFLRRLEHRLQYLDDAQTHSLPNTPDDQTIIAQAMGFTSYDALQAELDDHRIAVSQQFNSIFAEPGQSTQPPDGIWPPCVEVEDRACDTTARLVTLGYRQAPASAQRLAAVHAGNRYQQMPDLARSRFDALVPRVVEACAATPNPDEALTRILDLLEAVSRRAAYLSLLLEYPDGLQKLAHLAGASLWAANFLQHHPILLDELLDARILEAAPDWPALSRQLEHTLDEIEPDTERQMDLLRETHHAQLFRLLAQDLDGMLTLEKLADHLSALADVMLELALRFAWRKVSKRHCETPHFAIISYGKLGGKELGYASDLDLVFIYDDSAPEAPENYARLATRLNTWLSSQTAAGLLFETDLRLRPNGDSGLIVCSLETFRKYQIESAWLWEHQALTRARFSAGDHTIGDAFEAIRNEILRQPRDLENLKREVVAMRQKMFDAHATKGAQAEAVFDLKHDCGGLVDVEFIVQYLVLGHAHAHPELTGNLGNIALLRIAGELGLIPAALAETVRNAYRDYRHLQHRLRLNNARARVTPDSVSARAAAVCALWQIVFKEVRTNQPFALGSSTSAG
ncbi:MAG TPA: bifunctional [glutamate--ammonia ligase]-adenylyl-L-tyrosine phosphorylase/[glutamate--ammonia-ligase] adenylyltransferase [Rhodocyclaceae bacterium]|nr:bifunctional [glutamate--ammonia ligase]-adenylyl-L-tyrosine phosphorylase/[glutamate--ammonia-ligase] adenylyltransferase [Rhodocyclaceae bacterium]